MVAEALGELVELAGILAVRKMEVAPENQRLAWYYARNDPADFDLGVYHNEPYCTVCLCFPGDLNMPIRVLVDLGHNTCFAQVTRMKELISILSFECVLVMVAPNHSAMALKVEVKIGIAAGLGPKMA